MDHTLDAGDRCICQVDELYNAFGDGSEVLSLGMRLTVAGTRIVAGLRFLEFKETPDGTYFLAHHFRPLRSLN